MNPDDEMVWSSLDDDAYLSDALLRFARERYEERRRLAEREIQLGNGVGINYWQVVDAKVKDVESPKRSKTGFSKFINKHGL